MSTSRCALRSRVPRDAPPLAFDALYLRYAAEVASAIRRANRYLSAQDIEDAGQQVWIGFWRYWDRYQHWTEAHQRNTLLQSAAQRAWRYHENHMRRAGIAPMVSLEAMIERRGRETRYATT